jgi:hypothetical protein
LHSCVFCYYRVHINLSGKAKKAHLNCVGNSVLSARDFIVEECSASVSGSSTAIKMIIFGSFLTIYALFTTGNSTLVKWVIKVLKFSFKSETI